MSQAYRLTERAEADVEAIADFIATDSIDAAMKVVLGDTRNLAVLGNFCRTMGRDARQARLAW